MQAGRLADFPTIEWYIHTTVDPTLQDAQGRHNSALFVQWVPHTLAGTTWEAEEERYVRHLLAICDRFAPGTSDLVVVEGATHLFEEPGTLAEVALLATDWFTRHLLGVAASTTGSAAS